MVCLRDGTQVEDFKRFWFLILFDPHPEWCITFFYLVKLKIFTVLFQLVARACYITGLFWGGAITCEVHSYKSSRRVPENTCRYMGHSEKFVYWRATWGSFDGIFFSQKLYLILECLIISSAVLAGSGRYILFIIVFCLIYSVCLVR